MRKFHEMTFTLPPQGSEDYFRISEELNDIIEYQNGSINDSLTNVDGSRTFFIEFYSNDELNYELDDPIIRDYLL